MNRTDPFFLESRPLLIASREILDSFLQRLADESIDISELHLGYAEDAATLAYGTATRFVAAQTYKALHGWCLELRSCLFALSFVAALFESRARDRGQV